MTSARFYSRIIDITALTSSFLLLSLITDIASPMKYSIDLLVFVSVMYFSLRLCKRFIAERLHTSSRIAKIMLGNVVGLVLGALLVMLIDQFFAGETRLEC